MSSNKQVARSLSSYERRIKDMERAQRLKNSGVPSSLGVYDQTGALRIVLGQQSDGSFTVESSGGSKPPKPAVPVLAGEPQGALVTWSGLTAAGGGEEPLPDTDAPTGGDLVWQDTVWTDLEAQPKYADPVYATPTGYPVYADPDIYLDEVGAVVTVGDWEDPEDVPLPDPDDEFVDTLGRWPADFSHIEIHCLLQPTTGTSVATFTPTNATQVGTFLVAGRPARKTIHGLLKQRTYWFRLVSVSKSKRESRPSAPVSVLTLKDPLEEVVRLEDLITAAQDDATDLMNITETLNRVWRQPDEPVAPTGRGFVVGDIWFDTDAPTGANRMYVWNGTAWADTRDGGISQALQETSDLAATAVTEAQVGTISQTAANGRSKTTYSTSSPGTTPNIAGDIWFRKDGASQTIIGQWEGLGGTSWSAKTLTDAVIANLDAGKLVAGSAFTNALSVKNVFTLGDASTDGIIQSYNYAAATKGVFLNKYGITSKGGTITGATIQSVNDAGTGGVGGIKMTGTALTAFNASNQSTFSLDAASGAITMRGNITSELDINGGKITGTQIQTDPAANVGIKITSTGLVAYGGLTQKFTLSSAGAIWMDGGQLVGGTIKSAGFFGSVFCTALTDSGNRAILKDDGSAGILAFYDGDGALKGRVNGHYDGMTLTGGGTAKLRFDNTTIHFTAGAVYLNNGLQVDGTATCTRLNATNIYLLAAEKSGSPTANLTIGTEGRILEISSSQRFKDNIAVANIDVASALAMIPKSYTSLHQGDFGVAYVGFIAEEAAALGLDDWVERDSAGEITSFRYASWAVALQAIARNQAAQIVNLTNRVRALEPTD